MASHGRTYKVTARFHNGNVSHTYENVSEMRLHSSGVLEVFDMNGTSIATLSPHFWMRFQEVSGIKENYGG